MLIRAIHALLSKPTGEATARRVEFCHRSQVISKSERTRYADNPLAYTGVHLVELVSVTSTSVSANGTVVSPAGQRGRRPGKTKERSEVFVELPAPASKIVRRFDAQFDQILLTNPKSMQALHLLVFCLWLTKNWLAQTFPDNPHLCICITT
ncbi:hypothetical protein BJ742DRAFT_192406 [Cladochytrium replicatum]|nr:hypothetical protein BJ742DRAFT_192406 [Cladochytrium replicatum]